MARANLERSVSLSGAMKLESKYPYWIALEAIRSMPARTLYVEGFAVYGGRVLEHGWLELDGDILEMTPLWQTARGVEYFAGLKYQRARILELVQQLRVVPLAWVGKGYGSADPLYRQAYAQALLYANAAKRPGARPRSRALRGDDREAGAAREG